MSYQDTKNTVLRSFDEHFAIGQGRKWVLTTEEAYEVKSFLSTALDQIAKEVAEVAEVEMDVRTHTDEHQVLCQTLFNAPIKMCHQQLKEYFKGSGVLLEDNEKGI